MGPRRLLAVLALAGALAGCGASHNAASTPTALQRCETGAMRWARHFESDLPTPGTQAQVVALARPLFSICKQKRP